MTHVAAHEAEAAEPAPVPATTASPLSGAMGLTPATLLALQRTAGNAAVGRLLRRRSIARYAGVVQAPPPRLPPSVMMPAPMARGGTPGFGEAPGPFAGPPGGGIRYVGEPPQTLDELDKRIQQLDAEADAKYEAEKPMATLTTGGTAPDFVVDGGQGKVTVATEGPDPWRTIYFRIHYFDVLSALEHDVGRVNTEEQLNDVYASYFPDSLVSELPVGMGGSSIRTALSRNITIIYKPKEFDPGGTARLAVMTRAAKKRATQVQGMDTWELMRVIATSPVEAIADPERKQGPCQQKPVNRKGGNKVHNDYADFVTGGTMDFWVKTPEGLEANFDGQDAASADVVWEVKTRHEWASEAGIAGGSVFSPYINKHRIYKLEEERARFSAVARRCGFTLKFAFDDEELARFIKRHWGNSPEVVYRPRP